LHHKVLADLVIRLIAILKGNEGVDSLTGQFIGDTNDSGLSNHGYKQGQRLIRKSPFHSHSQLTVLDESSLDLSSGQAVTGNVNNIVNTATDPVVTVLIATSAISGELDNKSQ
jgi:hypothetical protein